MCLLPVTGEKCKIHTKCIKGITNKTEKFSRPDKTGTGHECEPIHELMEVLFPSFSFPAYSKFRNAGGGAGRGEVNAYIYKQNKHANTWSQQNTAIWKVLPTYGLINTGMLRSKTEISDCVTVDLHRTNKAQPLSQHD